MWYGRKPCSAISRATLTDELTLNMFRKEYDLASLKFRLRKQSREVDILQNPEVSNLEQFYAVYSLTRHNDTCVMFYAYFKDGKIGPGSFKSFEATEIQRIYSSRIPTQVWPP